MYDKPLFSVCILRFRRLFLDIVLNANEDYMKYLAVLCWSIVEKAKSSGGGGVEKKTLLLFVFIYSLMQLVPKCRKSLALLS